MRHCIVCARPNLREIDARLAGGVTERALAAETGISRAAIGRHRRAHLTPVIQAAARTLSRDNPARQARAEMLAAVEQGDPMAFLSLAAIVADQMKNHRRLDMAAGEAAEDGKHLALAGLSGQLTRSNEVRARWAGIDKPVAERNQPVTITINFSGEQVTTITAAPPFEDDA